MIELSFPIKVMFVDGAFAYFYLEAASAEGIAIKDFEGHQGFMPHTSYVVYWRASAEEYDAQLREYTTMKEEKKVMRMPSPLKKGGLL